MTPRQRAMWMVLLWSALLTVWVVAGLAHAVASGAWRLRTGLRTIGRARLGLGRMRSAA